MVKGHAACKGYQPVASEGLIFLEYHSQVAQSSSTNVQHPKLFLEGPIMHL